MVVQPIPGLGHIYLGLKKECVDTKSSSASLAQARKLCWILRISTFVVDDSPAAEDMRSCALRAALC